MVCAAPWSAGAVQQERRGSTRRRRKERPRVRQVGIATFYARELHGSRTANGQRYDEKALTAAHRTWPFGTLVRVTELESGRTVSVTITDRGPFGQSRRKGAVIDLSREAARRLDILDDGRARVRLEVLRWGAEAEANSER